jgi:hypothetical protein
MTIHTFAFADAPLKRSPGQEGDIFAGNVLDQRHGGPVIMTYSASWPSTEIRGSMQWSG